MPSWNSYKIQKVLAFSRKGRCATIQSALAGLLRNSKVSAGVELAPGTKCRVSSQDSHPRDGPQSTREFAEPDARGAGATHFRHECGLKRHDLQQSRPLRGCEARGGSAIEARAGSPSQNPNPLRVLAFSREGRCATIQFASVPHPTFNTWRLPGLSEVAREWSFEGPSRGARSKLKRFSHFPEKGGAQPPGLPS